LQAACENLDNVSRIVKLMVLVNSAPDFTEQHLVANGASELFAGCFRARPGHTRTVLAFRRGHKIPFGACVEIDLVAEMK